MVHVPYRGSAAAAKDATAGLVQLIIDPITAPLVRSGQLRGLAVSGNDLRDDLSACRASPMPAFPTGN